MSDISELTYINEVVEYEQRIADLERREKLLVDFAKATKELYKFPFGVYGANSPVWTIKKNFDSALQAAIDGGALGEGD